MHFHEIFPFGEIACWRAPSAAGGAGQMALDEAMLRLAQIPTLRIYRWAAPEVTFGYPQRWEEASAFAGTRPCIRRCTGGGFVEHGEDVTVSLAVPSAHPFARLAPARTYQLIHGAIRDALGADHFRLAGTAESSSGAACFANPAPADVLNEGRKVAGGAQRRSRDGFLYQGSVQGIPVGEKFDEHLGLALARHVTKWTPPSEWRSLYGELIETRYGSSEWNQKR